MSTNQIDSTRPTVVYVESSFDFGSKNYRPEAMCWVLRNVYQCNVLHYSSHYIFCQHVRELKELYNSGAVIVTLVKQDFCNYDIDTLIEVIEEELSRTLPLAIISQIEQVGTLNKYAGQGHIQILKPFDKLWLKLVEAVGMF